MNYVFRQRASTGARQLAVALGWNRVRHLPDLKAGDKVIGWGDQVPAPRGVQVLNGAEIRSKYNDALKLKEAGVPTIEVALHRPAMIPAVPAVAAVPAEDPAIPIFNNALELADEFIENQEPAIIRRPVFAAGVDQLINVFNRLKEAIGRPVPMARPARAAVPAQNNGEWIPRINNHVGGKDLLRPPAAKDIDYYVRKENIVEEFRIHSFLQKSIRAGKKVHREDFPNPSNWIRSWDGGWRIVYAGVKGDKNLRELAHRACRALNLDFGAVDIGKTRDGRLIVLEVNRAPGIENGTIDAYVKAIKGWEGN